MVKNDGKYIQLSNVLEILRQLNVDDFVYDAIQSVPLEDVAPVKHGKWIDMKVRLNHALICSVCGCGYGVMYEYKYCPHCGARMDGE